MHRQRKHVVPSVSWGLENNAPAPVRADEAEMERNVTASIGAMSFLSLDVDNDSGLKSLKGVIERNVIGLFSNRARAPACCNEDTESLPASAPA